MPNYTADLEWLRVNHPAEYDKIPREALNRSDVRQLHGSIENSTTGGTNWLIVLFSDLDEDFVHSVELGIERPAPETLPGTCAHHTLRLSREFCPKCKGLTDAGI